MSTKISHLQCKEVICIGDGRRLGYIADIQIEIPEGQITAIIVPGPCKCFGLASPREDFCIPWHCIKKIGPDVVLVDANPDQCRIRRPKKPGLP